MWMKRSQAAPLLVSLLALFLLLADGCGKTKNEESTRTEIVSGTLVDGYRVIEVPTGGSDLPLTVYRGDYVKFLPAGHPPESLLTIASMGIETRLTADVEDAPYFKMKEIGTFPFTLGDSRGKIRVVEFSGPRYTEVTAEEGVRLIDNLQPLILDVRTPPEYAQDHLQGAVLIPVQELQRRIGEISAKKDEPVFIYCATGNRSTVAAKILIDGGFRRIYNLRHGIAEWKGKGLPVQH